MSSSLSSGRITFNPIVIESIEDPSRTTIGIIATGTIRKGSGTIDRCSLRTPGSEPDHVDCSHLAELTAVAMSGVSGPIGNRSTPS